MVVISLCLIVLFEAVDVKKAYHDTNIIDVCCSYAIMKMSFLSYGRYIRDPDESTRTDVESFDPTKISIN